MHVDGYQGTQYTSRQLWYLATNDGGEFVEVDEGFLFEFFDGFDAITVCGKTGGNLLAPHRLGDCQYNLKKKTKENGNSDL